MDATQLYLDLMKKAVSCQLWEDPGRPIETFRHRVPAVLRPLVKLLIRTMDKANLKLVRKIHYTEEEILNGATWPAQADTMIGIRRLDNIQVPVLKHPSRRGFPVI